MLNKSWQKPPIKLKVKNPWDTKHVDRAFLNEEVKETPDYKGVLAMHDNEEDLLH